MERKTDNTRNQRQARRRKREKKWLLENGWRSWEALHTALIKGSVRLDKSINQIHSPNDPVLSCSGGLVGGDDHAFGRGLAVHQLPALRLGAFGEQALAAADGEGEGPHVHAVDQPVREQGLDEVAAAVHPQVGAVILLELFQLGRHIAADQEGVLPGEGHGGVGHDVFARCC